MFVNLLEWQTCLEPRYALFLQNQFILKFINELC